MKKTPTTTEVEILMDGTTEEELESFVKHNNNNNNNNDDNNNNTSTSNLHLSPPPSYGRPGDNAHRVGTMTATRPHNRSWLHAQAAVWRFLMSIGMFLHTVGWKHVRPSFVRRIPFGTAGRTVDLYFYCPPSYWQNKKRRRLSQHRPYPVVVNFHGGGFALGRATDDSFWAKCVLKETDAVFVSVEYRLAPENPFPAAVDDGVEALLYLAAHAGELNIDASRIALTGFSSGGNLAITVPLRLQERIKNEAGSDIVHIEPFESTQHLVGNQGNLQIVASFAWYPLLDFVASRAYRRANSVFPGKTMPSFFTTLFDESYLPDHAERFSPFASPERAPDEMLREGLPDNFFLYTCEWDMLLQEGQRFVRRLQNMGKKVRTFMVEKVPHAWDKSPNPFRDQRKIDVFYKTACDEMKVIFDNH